MASRTWQLNLDGKQHTIELKHNYLSSKRKVFLDNRLVHESTSLIDFGSDTPVPIAGHDVYAHIRTNGLSYQYDCSVDGYSIESGEPVTISAQEKAPRWAWLFVIACGAIPLIALGGAIPLFIGFMGAGYSYQTSRDISIPEQQRIGKCVLATLVAWGAFILFAGGITMLMGEA